MTEFEKLVVETPITMDCFEMNDFNDLDTQEGALALKECQWASLIDWLEDLRKTYDETKDKRYLDELIRLLPNTYRVRKGNIQYEFREIECHKMI